MWSKNYQQICKRTTYQDINHRTFATAGILEGGELVFLPEQEFLNIIAFPMICAKKKLTKAAIPNPNAGLVGK